MSTGPLRRDWTASGAVRRRPTGTRSASTPTLNDVDMLSSTDGWAVGNDGVILHRDGSVWTQTNSGTSRSLFAVDAVSVDAAWAASGDNENPGFI